MSAPARGRDGVTLSSPPGYRARQIVGALRGRESSVPPAMNHKQAHTLQELFEHPIRLNLKWPAVVSLFNALGEVTVESHDRFRVEIDGHCEVYHPPHRTDMSADDIVKVRKFLELTGHVPDQERPPPADGTAGRVGADGTAPLPGPSAGDPTGTGD
ncbi:MAG: hypothetical protein ACYCV5_05455 [Acidimicrobiales bacterium]